MIAPIGLVPKSILGEFRFIFDLSYPTSKSVNAGIPSELCSVQYTSFDAAMDMVVKAGRGAYLIKVDINSAFRLLPIHPDDFCLLGMQHDGYFLVDKALPFGCSISCALFQKFSTFLECCVRFASQPEEVMHYLDDFCGCNSSATGAHMFVSTILTTFDELGAPVAHGKAKGPATCPDN